MQVNNIKKHPSRNEYCYGSNGIWVRNFTKEIVKPYDINEESISERDATIFLTNEMENSKKMFQRIDTEIFEFRKIAIVSNGYKFKERHKLLENIKDLIILGVNNTINLWESPRKMNFYIVNNPYKECLDFLPTNLFPRCIASARTYSEFLSRYKNIIYEYSPTKNRYYSGLKSDADYFIDDYRNPICASIGLAYKFKVKKLLLLCCDNVQEIERPGMVKIDNLWIYPQQIMAHNIIDTNLFWLKNISVGYYSDGIKFDNAEYIQPERFKEFFNE